VGRELRGRESSRGAVTERGALERGAVASTLGAVLPMETEAAVFESERREPGAARRESVLGLASAALRKA